MPCFGEKPERTCHVSFTGLETLRKSKIRERERERRDVQSERELASCAMPCVKAFTHDCLLVSAELLLVPFVVSTAVSQLPRALCSCAHAQISC